MSLAASFHDPFGWSRPDLTPDDVQMGLQHARDPDQDITAGPVEQVLSLSDAPRAWANHEALHAWRLGQGRLRQAHQARALFCGRLLAGGFWREVRPHLLESVAALVPGERGPFSHFLEIRRVGLSPMDMSDRDLLRRCMSESRWAPVLAHEGQWGVAEGWEMMGWLGTAGSSPADGAVSFKTTAVYESFKDLFKTWSMRFSDAERLDQMARLADHLEQGWQELSTQEPAKMSRREVAGVAAWLFGLELLGRDACHAVEHTSAILLDHPAWGLGFDLIRQTCPRSARLNQTCETALSVQSESRPTEAGDAFLWRALPMPSMISSSEPILSERVEQQWLTLWARHPEWVVSRPLPTPLLTALEAQPKLLATWRVQVANASDLSSAPLPRTRPRLRS